MRAGVTYSALPWAVILVTALLCTPALGLEWFLPSIFSSSGTSKSKSSTRPFIPQGKTYGSGAVVNPAGFPPLPPSWRRAAEEILQDTAPQLPPTGGTWLPEFKTPCWKTFEGAVKCIPYAYILGVWQCGTKDLEERLMLHPQVAPPMGHSNYYFEIRPFEDLLRETGRALPALRKDPEGAVAVDASGGTFTFTWTHSERLHQDYTEYMRSCWKECIETHQGGEVAAREAARVACMDTRCFPQALSIQAATHRARGGEIEVPALLKSVAREDVKLMVILRNPIDRLWAAYWFYQHYSQHYGKTAAGFHDYCVEAITEFEHCSTTHGKMKCAFQFESLAPRYEHVFYHADQLIKSLYSAFLPGWLSAYPNGNLLVLRLEDYNKHTKRELEKVFRHLEVDTPTDEQWTKILDAPVQTKGGHNPVHKPPPGVKMLEQTRALLQVFFDPWNGELAHMLDDEKFLWKDHQH